MATWDDVAAVVAELPETELGTSYGERAWKVRKKTLVWERPLRRSDREALGPDAPTGDILGLRTESEDEKLALIAAYPEVFFTTPHFDGYAAVLAQLAPLPVDVLRHLVRAEWRRRAPKRVVAAFLAGSG